MNIIRKNDFEKLIISCWMMLFAIWGYVAISGNYFEIVIANPTIIKICDFIDNNFILNNLVRFIMYYLNWIFVVYAILRERLFKYKPILISLSIFAVWLVKTIFINIEIFNYTDAIMFIALAIVCKRKWYRSLIGAVLTFIFAFVSSFIKNLFIPTSVAGMNVYSIVGLVFMIDYILMSIIYYLTIIKRKEIKANATLSNNAKQLGYLVQIKQKVENYFSSIGNSISSFISRNRSVASIRSKAYELYCGVIFTLLTYLSLLIIGIIFDRWIEMTVSAVFFHIFRGKDEETYHAKNDLMCWCVSMLSFLIIMKLTLPIYISYIVSILLSFILCMIMRFVYFVRKLVDKFKITKQKDKRNTIIELVGKDNLTEEYIENLCSQYGLTTKYSETVYLYINNTLEETADLLGIDCRTVSRRLNTFIEKCSKI